MTSIAEPVHFLLVDDLQENLLSLEGLLRHEGLVLLKARSGDEALELLLRHDVALALVDVQMPDLDGFELAELMRGNERTRRVPIIFVTAGSADGQRRFRGYEAGAVDFIHKPIEPDILRSKAESSSNSTGSGNRLRLRGTSSRRNPRPCSRPIVERTNSWRLWRTSFVTRWRRFATAWTSCERRRTARTQAKSRR